MEEHKMFELAWKIIEPNGNQPIKMKSFSTEEKRQDFIDTIHYLSRHF